MLKKLGRDPRFLKALGHLMAYYLLLVRKTSTFEIDPSARLEQMEPHLPFIAAMWHGQHFLTPFARPDTVPVSVMISRSADGQINAVAAERLGIGTIRASGAQQAHQIKKRGGLKGFIEALRCLRSGSVIAMTADVPKGPARKAGMGIVQLARHSGRPIIPMAIASSRHYDFSSWDKASLNLPFSHIGVTMGEPIFVPSQASDEELEALRFQLEDSLNLTTERAYDIAKRRKGQNTGEA
ncbi:lysophospholipid acyltransferase family protein [Polycladidibacter hongkongensis]|uniref:lysophospholipid acyltransferase family protein n=1 Tax=Polycladidibacter hongkongensis TaxID=1647556 RepID=UPI00082AB06D|nr:lysophospholipid acyltransferase family protein [Pseudovibrio hongkongensis]